VYAARDGVVLTASARGGYGNVIVIDHGDGMSTVYAHLSKFNVEAGDELKVGDDIGDIGSTGNSTGPHLHFEIRLGGSPTDPLQWL
jgi:murein DD-endopeptidase MepM/ murein hydrolase activator NlpD